MKLRRSHHPSLTSSSATATSGPSAASQPLGGSSRTLSPHPQRRRLPNSQALRAIAWRWRFVFLGLVAAFVLNSIMSTIGTKEQHTILVATRDIPAGTYVERSHITEVIVGDHLAGLASLPEQIVGHALIAPVEEGAPLPLSNIINEDFLSKPRDGYVITAVELADTEGWIYSKLDQSSMFMLVRASILMNPKLA